MGIEPTSKAWEALVLPLNYARNNFILQNFCYTRRKKLRVMFFAQFFWGPEDLSGFWIFNCMGTLVRGARGLIRADAVCDLVIKN